jgi:hypothetical protein
MPAPPYPVTAVLIVRVWIEDHPTSPLRAVITEVSDLESEAEPLRISASSVDDVSAIVRAWMVDLLGDGRSA